MNSTFRWAGLIGLWTTVMACAVPVTGAGASDEAATTTGGEGESCGGRANRKCQAGLTCSALAPKRGTCVAASGPAIDEVFETPSAEGLEPVIDAIAGAQSQIRMMMFHLTVMPVVDALAAAAKRGVDVEIILDAGNLASHTPAAIRAELTEAGVKIVASSSGFAITHVKSMVIDEETAVIMSLNLTNKFTMTRDFAVTTRDASVVKEFLAVFAADVKNARTGGNTTPALTSPYLAWSPVNTESKIAAFVDAAKTSLVVTTENLGDKVVMIALENAAARGVAVRVITPLCDQNVNPLLDLPYLATLAAAGVETHAMPYPESAEQPYMHAKMMVADGDKAFLGSVNLSMQSMTRARELGIFFADANAIRLLTSTFESDWAASATPPDMANVSCPGGR
jgi:phosphatidylserine/phosphatidylglycerophosphate/cardiolipin synthase-like enzyme